MPEIVATTSAARVDKAEAYTTRGAFSYGIAALTRTAPGPEGLAMDTIAPDLEERAVLEDQVAAFTMILPVN
jgi:hypothetical protein